MGGKAAPQVEEEASHAVEVGTQADEAKDAQDKEAEARRGRLKDFKCKHQHAGPQATENVWVIL
jgi:hypothetical protein